MGMTSTSEQVQNINQGLENESANLFDLARLMAQQGYNPYQGADIAGHTDAQRAAFDMMNQASGAFGFQQAAPPQQGPMRDIGTGSPVEAFSSYDTMMRQPGAQQQMADVNSLFAQMARQPKKVKQESAGSGGKK